VGYVARSISTLVSGPPRLDANTRRAAPHFARREPTARWPRDLEQHGQPGNRVPAGVVEFDQALQPGRVQIRRAAFELAFRCTAYWANANDSAAMRVRGAHDCRSQ